MILIEQWEYRHTVDMEAKVNKALKKENSHWNKLQNVSQGCNHLLANSDFQPPAKDALITALGLKCGTQTASSFKKQSSCRNLQPPSESFIILNLPVLPKVHVASRECQVSSKKESPWKSPTYELGGIL